MLEHFCNFEKYLCRDKEVDRDHHCGLHPSLDSFRGKRGRYKLWKTRMGPYNSPIEDQEDVPKYMMDLAMKAVIQ